MKYIIKKGLLLFSIASLFFSCIRKKDFELNKVKWDDITPAWGLPMVNSTLSIDQALAKNTSSLIIQRDPDGFITFIYLDTVYSPDGTVLLEKFKLAIPNIHEGLSLGTFPALPPTNSKIPTSSLPSFDGTFNFVLDSVESIKKVTFQEGLLKIQPKSLIRHDLSFRLTIPGLKDAFGTPFSTLVDLFYDGTTLPIVAQQIAQKLNGYSMVTNGSTNTIAYSIDNLSITTKSDAGNSISNPILSTDSITVDISFDGLQLKSILGKMMPVHLKNVPRGETVINAFDNALSGNISFENPSINFTFENSFGLTPSIRIDSASMQYAYSNQSKDFMVKTSVMEIPGITSITPASTFGQFTPTPTIVISRNTSNIIEVLQGAPNKFVYKIGSIGLSSGNNDAFISDDSQIKINTEVKIPLFGSVKNLIISDTIKNVEMLKADNVDYIEFRAGSDNSIPATVQLQAYFCDTTLFTFDGTGKKKYIILDSLVSPESAGIIVAPGDIEEIDNFGNITKTKINSFATTIPVSKEKYRRVEKANLILVKGTLFTKESENNKNVKFFTWQKCTFRLAAFAKLRINPGSPDDIINIGK
jgi:hypothetical protein